MQKKAFQPHYSKFLFVKAKIGLDDRLEKHPQVILVDGDFQIDDELSLFIVEDRSRCYSEANDALYENKEKDDFAHEQNLLIDDGERVLLTGCGHAGIVNILERAKAFDPHVCIGGYHLFNPLTKKTVSDKLLADIAQALQGYPKMSFYTCHCTGAVAFGYLAKKVSNIFYLACGEEIEI